MLRALVGRVGADRVILGSDYPIGEADPVGFVERCPGLSPEPVTVTAFMAAPRVQDPPSGPVIIARHISELT